MIDIRYHIASIVAVFLALGLGILIGSTIVGDNLLVDQQKKMIDRLEDQFDVLRNREEALLADNEHKTNIINNYENYSQALLPMLVKDRLPGFQAAIVVTGDVEVPASLLNTLNNAGAAVSSRTVVLTKMNLEEPALRKRLEEFYGLEAGSKADTIRQYLAASVAAVISGQADGDIIRFLQDNGLVKISGNTAVAVNGVIMVGGANQLSANFANSFDLALIRDFNRMGIRVYGVEPSQVTYSYMGEYQETAISTVDNIDQSTGQISLVYSMAGEPGHYGIKETAQKFIPSLPVNAPGGVH